MNIQKNLLVKNYNIETYNQALDKLKNSTGKVLFIDQKLGVHYANLFRRIFEKIKACFGKIDQTSSEIVQERLIQFIKFGENKGWLDTKKIDEISNQFFKLSPKISRDSRNTQTLTKPSDKASSSQISDLNEINHNTKKQSNAKIDSSATIEEDFQSIQPPLITSNLCEKTSNKNLDLPGILSNSSKMPETTVKETAQANTSNETQPQQILPLFVFDDQTGTRSIFDTLKKTYPLGIFAVESEVQTHIEQNRNQQIEIFYIKRFDDSFDTRAELIDSMNQILRDHQNIHLTFIGASLQIDNIRLEEKMSEFQEYLQSNSFPNPQIKETKTMTIRFKSKRGGKQTLDSNVEKKFIEQMNQQLGPNYPKPSTLSLNTSQLNVQSPLNLKNQNTEPSQKEQNIEKPQSIQPIQKKESPSPLPLFIFSNLYDSRAIHAALKKTYPNGIFISEEESEIFLKQNSSQPIQAFYFIAFDNRLDDRESLVKIINEILKYPNVNLVYAGAAQDTDSLNIEQSMKGFQKYIDDNVSIPQDREVKTMSMRYHVMATEAGTVQSLEPALEKNFLNQIQQFLNKK